MVESNTTIHDKLLRIILKRKILSLNPIHTTEIQALTPPMLLETCLTQISKLGRQIPQIIPITVYHVYYHWILAPYNYLSIFID